MKNKVINLLSLLTIGSFMVFSLMENSIDSAKADGHKHVYTNGVCECGTRVFECEDGDIQGTMTSTDIGDTFVNSKDSSDNPDHPVSGTGFVEYMACYGNSITWKFSLSEKLENVRCHFWISTGQDNKSTSSLNVNVNGVRGKWETKNVEYPGNGYWYYFLDCEVYLNFAKGNNTLTMINESGFSYNFDCLEVEMPKTVVYGAFVDGQPDGEMPDKNPWGTGSEEENVDKPLDPVSAKKTLIMEAEYCHNIIGTNGSGSDTWYKNDDNASGGAVVTNFAYVGDNVITFKFQADKPVTAATISIYLGTACVGTEWVQIFIPRINGGSGGATPFDTTRWPGTFGIDISSLGSNSTHFDRDEYIPVTIPETVNLKQGENIFEIEAWQGQLMNVDYVEISTTEDVTFTYTPISRGFGGKGGPTSVEAELGQVKGKSSDAENESFILEKTATGERATSEGKCIGNFAVAGNELKMPFRSNIEVKSTTVSLFLASQDNGGELKNIITLTLNGEAIDLTGKTLPSGTKDTVVWTEFKFENIKVLAGLNKLIIKNVTGADFLIDNLFLELPLICNLSTKNLDKNAPTVSSIYFLTKGIRTQKEVEFTFDYSDDFSEKEELTVAVQVYFNYAKSNQVKFLVENNKFTPEYLGDYTIMVSVTDQANRTTTKRRVLRVKYGQDKVEKVVKYVDKKQVGGWLTFGLGMLLAAGMVTYMVIASKKKA